jgi:hypothetical protein
MRYHRRPTLLLWRNASPSRRSSARSHQHLRDNLLVFASFEIRAGVDGVPARPVLGARQIGRCYFADGYFAEDKPNPISDVCDGSRMEPFSLSAYRPLTSPDLLDVRIASA